MEVPHVDPTGYDVVVWMLNNEVYFAEVANGIIYMIGPSLLMEVISGFPAEYLIGILMPDGRLGMVGKNRLQ